MSFTIPNSGLGRPFGLIKCWYGWLPFEPSGCHQHWPVQKFLSFVVGVDGGKALYAGCYVGEERWLCDIVQTLQLSNQDPGERMSSMSEWQTSNSGFIPGRCKYVLFTWKQCAELKRGWRGAPLPPGTMGKLQRSFQHRRTPGWHFGWTSQPGTAGVHRLQKS